MATPSLAPTGRADSPASDHRDLHNKERDALATPVDRLTSGVNALLVCNASATPSACLLALTTATRRANPSTSARPCRRRVTLEASAVPTAHNTGLATPARKGLCAPPRRETACPSTALTAPAKKSPASASASNQFFSDHRDRHNKEKDALATPVDRLISDVNA